MKKNKTAEYTADSIRLITDNIEKVRTSMSMYTKYGNRGFLHLIREVLNNAADEASGLFANHIKVFYDENTKKVVISDNGRGIPIDALHMVFTELHKSGKKDKGSEESAYEFTSGTNGVGVTVVNALSEYLICRVKTGGKQSVIEFRHGIQVSHTTSEYKGKDSGTEVEFVPLEYLDDREMLGTVDLPANEVYDLTKDLGYLTPKGVVTELEIVP
ncbi:MAG: ATP-binding protein, partial [Paraclostridium sp.]